MDPDPDSDPDPQHWLKPIIKSKLRQRPKPENIRINLRQLEPSVADPDPYVSGLLDPNPDQLVRGMDSDQDPSIIMQKRWENLDFNVFVTFYL